MTFDPKQTRPFHINQPHAFVITVHAEILDTVTGGWCDHCLLPSIVTQLFEVFADNMSLGLKQVWYCDSCGRQGEV